MYSRIELPGWDFADSGRDLGRSRDPSGVREAEQADGRFFAPVSNDTSVYILRHGRSEGNATLTFQGRMNYPLDSLGVKQAEGAARWLKDKEIDAVLSSPLDRALVTATIISESCGLGAPAILPSLAEIDVGMFSGISMEKARVEYPDIYRVFEYSSWDAVPGAESSTRLYERAMASWDEVRRIAVGGARRIVCISHGGLIQWLIRSTFGARSWLPLVPTSNCGIAQYDIEATSPGNPAFVQWSRINFHAPEVAQGTKPIF